MRYRDRSHSPLGTSSKKRGSLSTFFHFFCVVSFALVLTLSATGFFSAQPQANAFRWEGPTIGDAIARANSKVPTNAGVAGVELDYRPSGVPQVLGLQHFNGIVDGKYVSKSQFGEEVTFTLSPDLHRYAEELLEKYRVPWGALVAIEPATGKVLALASYSASDRSDTTFALRPEFPAASLFKIITGAAAVETKGLSGNSVLRYRGGNYTLNKYNYLPNSRSDRRKMSLAEAMAKSCNPVFGRIALEHVGDSNLQRYAESFGFNSGMGFDLPIANSSFELPDSEYQLARTGAGFGDVKISPLHAAVLMSTVANGGKLMRPFLIEKIQDQSGELIFENSPTTLRSVVLSDTADELVEMMRGTVIEGTAKTAYRGIRKGALASIPVASKTGTLSGDSPKGVYRWMVASAPVSEPKIAVAAVVVDPGTARVKGPSLALQFLNHYADTVSK